MSEQRRLTDKIKFITLVVTSIVVTVSAISTVYSWYFVGKDTCIKVQKLEVGFVDHEKRIVEEEKKSSVQFEINKKVDRIEQKIDILIMRK